MCRIKKHSFESFCGSRSVKADLWTSSKPQELPHYLFLFTASMFDNNITTVVLSVALRIVRCQHRELRKVRAECSNQVLISTVSTNVSLSSTESMSLERLIHFPNSEYEGRPLSHHYHNHCGHEELVIRPVCCPQS